MIETIENVCLCVFVVASTVVMITLAILLIKQLFE